MDIYACGVLLYAMLNGCFPFKGTNDKDLYKKIVKGSFTIPDHVSTGARNLLSRMLSGDADMRPVAKQIFNDEWLSLGPNE